MEVMNLSFEADKSYTNVNIWMLSKAPIIITVLR